MRNIERNLGRLDKQAKGVTSSFKLLGGALAAVVTGGAIRSIVQTTARFEDLQDTLNTVTGSARDGAKAFDFVKQFATSTQFGVEELTNTFIKLKGSGIEPTSKLLTTFTDAAAVTTDQIGTLNAITDLFSRTTSGGLGLEELNRLADRGLPVFKILEEQIGITRLEVSEFGKTAEGARKITEALAAGINQRFGGATQDKMDNLSTAMSNFGIAVTNAASDLGNKFRPQLTQAITEATKFLETNDKLIDALGVGIGDAITATSNSLKFIADNFTAIKNAAIALIGLRIAAFFGTLASRLSSAIGPAKSLTGIFGGMTKAIGTTLTRIPLLGGALAGLGTLAVKLGPALMNPFIGIPAAIAVAVTGGLFYFQDSIVKVGDTTASLGEVTGAVFSLIGDQIKKVTSFLGDAFFKALTSIGEFFQNSMLKPASRSFNRLLDIAKGALNFILNSFVVTFEFIRGIIFNLPQFFVGAFRAVMSIASDFSGALTQKFSNLGDAIGAAFRGDFEGAMEAVGRDVGFSFGESINKALAEVPPVIPEVDVEGIMKVDRVAQGIDAVKSSVGLAISITGDYISNALEPLETAIETKIKNDRAEAAAIALKNHKMIEAAHATEFAYQAQQVNNQVTEDAVTVNEKLNKELDKRKSASARIVEQLQNEALDLEDLKKALANVNDISRITGIAVDVLTESFQKQIDILEGNTEAVKKNTKEKEKQKTVVDLLISSIKDEKRDLALLENALGDVDKISKATGISTSELTAALTERINVLKGVTEETKKQGEATKTFAEQINESITKNGEAFSSSLARSLAQGKASLGDFKGFLNKTLEDIAAMIIQKRITDPFINSITAGLTGGTTGGFNLGTLFGSFGSAGAGTGGGFFSNIFSSIGNFFGGFFANGGPVTAGKGYVVGERGPEMFMPRTAGTIVPNDELNMGGGETNVTFNINAVDTQTGVEFLLKNKPQIIGMVTQAQNQRGRQGITA